MNTLMGVGWVLGGGVEFKVNLRLLCLKKMSAIKGFNISHH